MDDRKVLIAVHTRPDLMALDGSVEVKCMTCHAICCISPASVALLNRSPGMEIYCTDCLPDDLKNEKSQIVPGSAELIQRRMPGVSQEQAQQLLDAISGTSIGHLVEVASRYLVQDD